MHTLGLIRATNWLNLHEQAVVEGLAKLVAIKSVSTDENHEADIERGAKVVRQQMHRAGLERTEIIRIQNSNPYIYGEWCGAVGKPTLLLYAHHDVQPANGNQGWDTSPWKLTQQKGRLYGRGSADDKGAITAYLAVISAFLKTSGQLPVNLKMLVEGEEEIGSPNLAAFFKKFRKKIHADVVIVCDTENLATGLPSITHSLRGIVQILVEVESGSRAVHSGMGGGMIADAALALNVLLARLYSGNGKAAVPGLEKSVLKLTQNERNVLRQLPGDEKAMRRDFGVLPNVRLAMHAGTHPYKQLWRHPSITVIAQEASSIRGRSNQILPKASAVLSCRTVPNQKSKEVFRFIRDLLCTMPPWNVRVNVKQIGEVDWWMIDPKGPAFDAARKALEAGFGTKPVMIGGGGSIGFIKPLQKLLRGAPVLLLGIEDPQSNAHAANESIHLGDFRKLMISLAHLFHNLGIA